MLQRCDWQRCSAGLFWEKLLPSLHLHHCARMSVRVCVCVCVCVCACVCVCQWHFSLHRGRCFASMCFVHLTLNSLQQLSNQIIYFVIKHRIFRLICQKDRKKESGEKCISLLWHKDWVICPKGCWQVVFVFCCVVLTGGKVRRSVAECDYQRVKLFSK